MKRYFKPYKKSIEIENLLKAWEEFLSGKKKRSDVIEFQARLMDNIFLLQEDLSRNCYRHGGYQAFNITDPKPRNIHKATVRDRLLHHLIYNELYPYFDEKFIFDSYSCRIGKGTHKAVSRFRKFSGLVSVHTTRTCWVLKCDVRKFFASIDHNILKKILEHYINDQDMKALLGKVIDSFHTEKKTATGLPLGNLTSQLLVNIYMNQFDQFVKRTLKVRHYIRYADDFVILSEDKEWLKSILPTIKDFLWIKLRLELHPNKISLRTIASGVDFLGWIIFPDHIVLRTTTKRRMYRGIKEKRGNTETVQSYLGLLSHGNTYKLKSHVKRYAKEVLEFEN